MFRKLRTKLILMNLGITTVVIVVAFTAIYVFATKAASNRPPLPEQQTMIFSEDFENTINITIRKERQAAANDLLIMLIISGVAIELIVAGISFYLAEESIKPVREAYEAQKVFIANASHEIKTPLAAIAANLEAADIQDNKWIQNVETETEKLTTLNNELLTLARTDLVKKRDTVEVDLARLVKGELKRFEPRLGDKQLQTEIKSNGKTKLAKADYVQILGILIDNAIKYSDKLIDVTLKDGKLAVRNDGVKIKKKDVEHVFERFYQVDKSADGVGLGLAIAKSIASHNNWSLTAGSHDEMAEFVLKVY